MSSASEREHLPLWRVSINGQNFEGRFRLPTDALTSAMRRYLAGVRRLHDGVWCWERHVQPGPGEERAIAVINGARGNRIWLVPMVPTAEREQAFPATHRTRCHLENSRDPKSGAMPHAVHSDYAIFVERLDGET